jgi:hypothetical protein
MSRFQLRSSEFTFGPFESRLSRIASVHVPTGLSPQLRTLVIFQLKRGR